MVYVWIKFCLIAKPNISHQIALQNIGKCSLLQYSAVCRDEEFLISFMIVLQESFKTQSYFGGDLKYFLTILMHSNIQFEVIHKYVPIKVLSLFEDNTAARKKIVNNDPVLTSR